MTRLPFEMFLGLRYLKPKRTFVSVITLISLSGVTIGVWVLIVVIAVMSGFDRELREKLMGMHAHVTVMGGLIEHSDKLLATTLATPHVKAATPFVTGPVLIEFEHRVTTPYLRASIRSGKSPSANSVRISRRAASTWTGTRWSSDASWRRNTAFSLATKSR
jgi:ABC-type lipoprotein release transport system permease subunit